jgi:hypothetical protein
MTGHSTPRPYDPIWLAKHSERQQKFLLTGVGKKFAQEYLGRKGNHTYVIGNTGSGKTQRNYWLVDFLRHTENIIWMSTGKSDEILPLLFMGCKVRIIIPEDAEFNIIGLDELERKPEIIRIKTAGEAWWNVWGSDWDENRNKTFEKITIFEFRNTLSPDIRSDWIAQLFTDLANWSLEGIMPKIFPCSIFIDESQWVLAGTRITTDQKRNKTSEIVTENALEIRSKGGRLIFSAQDHRNVTPASRENMLNAILCRGANVNAEENKSWSEACGDYRRGISYTSSFMRNESRFVFDDGRFYPLDPWKFPLYPINEDDREKMNRMTVKYGRKHFGRTPEEEEAEECFPELGRFSASAIPPEKQEVLAMSRYDVVDTDG